MARQKKIVLANAFIGPRIKLPPLTPGLDPGKPKKSKFSNIVTIVHGIRFMSKLEANRYEELFLLRLADHIRSLELQVKFDLHALGGEKICHYLADFCYDELVAGEWVPVVEDSKGMRTPIFSMKAKWMLAEHGITIRETRKKSSRGRGRRRR